MYLFFVQSRKIKIKHQEVLLLLSTCFQCNLIFFSSHRNVKNKKKKCFFDLSTSTQTVTCGVQKHDDISVNGIEEKKKKSIAHTTKSNLLLWSRKSNSSNSSTLLPNRSTDMMCCAQDRETERKMRMRTRARAQKTYYFYKLTSLHDHRPNTDLHKQTTDSSSVQLRQKRSKCNMY